MKSVKQVVVVRKDLKLRKSKVAALTSQVSTRFLTENNESDRLDELYVRLSNEEAIWLQNLSAPIVLGINSQNALNNLIFQAKLLGINVHSITGSFTTSKEDDSILCVAFGPDEEELINKITGNLKPI
jgi:PTH2 family peptidyl-tRNA hydrolase